VESLPADGKCEGVSSVRRNLNGSRVTKRRSNGESTSLDTRANQGNSSRISRKDSNFLREVDHSPKPDGTGPEDCAAETSSGMVLGGDMIIY